MVAVAAAVVVVAVVVPVSTKLPGRIWRSQWIKLRTTPLLAYIDPPISVRNVEISYLTGRLNWARSDLTGLLDWARSDLTGLFD